jgi:hypothetical protein
MAFSAGILRWHTPPLDSNKVCRMWVMGRSAPWKDRISTAAENYDGQFEDPEIYLLSTPLECVYYK